MAGCSAGAAAVGEVAAVAAAAPGTPCCHRPCTPEAPVPVGRHPVVGSLVLGRSAAAAAGRDNHWAEVDLGHRRAAAGSVAVTVVVGPNVWTMTTMTVCW